MVKLSMLMAGLAASATMAGVVEKRNERRCATRDLTPEEKEATKGEATKGEATKEEPKEEPTSPWASSSTTAARRQKSAHR
ncbi:hypothetical protein OCS_05076 [Ophiocordyceps sinensis CO18]|uniref:Uncharacterized protein n=1 Tax=Ophiocordyceps sinensis (strain Co18 / CGMCC 3.14243) TaxID=911162 RepID=T5ABW3_OPHSC|nr:hypothetical protein OCS_05076 [Ophiocordyceps sinensis CO18]